MNMTYQRKLTLSFLVIFVIFTTGVILFEQNQAYRYRTEALEEKLDAYAEMIHDCVVSDTTGGNALQWLVSTMPRDLRLTVINADGRVVFDNIADTVALLNQIPARNFRQCTAQRRLADPETIRKLLLRRKKRPRRTRRRYSATAPRRCSPWGWRPSLPRECGRPGRGSLPAGPSSTGGWT